MELLERLTGISDRNLHVVALTGAGISIGGEWRAYLQRYRIDVENPVARKLASRAGLPWNTS
jgi:hypothetical protein